MIFKPVLLIFLLFATQLLSKELNYIESTKGLQLIHTGKVLYSINQIGFTDYDVWCYQSYFKLLYQTKMVPPLPQMLFPKIYSVHPQKRISKTKKKNPFPQLNSFISWTLVLSYAQKMGIQSISKSEIDKHLALLRKKAQSLISLDKWLKQHQISKEKLRKLINEQLVVEQYLGLKLNIETTPTPKKSFIRLIEQLKKSELVLTRDS